MKNARMKATESSDEYLLCVSAEVREILARARPQAAGCEARGEDLNKKS
jgi:hypothetical protein